jgi:exocyst complex component 3
MRKKATVDTRLRSCVQTQLDEVTTVLQALHKAAKDIHDIRTSLDEATSVFDTCRDIEPYAEHALSLSMKRNHMRSTLQQLDRIFSVPEDVSAIRAEVDRLNSGVEEEEEEPNMLSIQQRISVLESCRDQILMLLQKHNQESSVIVAGAALSPMEDYFECVTRLAMQFKKIILDKIDDPIKLGKENPTTMVTILRIIEREEILDLKRVSPKKLKDIFWHNLNEQILDVFHKKFSRDKKLIGDFITAFRTFYLENLIDVKEHVAPCFPASYNILDYYVTRYSNYISIVLETLSKILKPNTLTPLRYHTQLCIYAEEKIKTVVGTSN